MHNLVQTIILGLGPGAVDGIMALGIVATFRVSGVINFALGATGTLGMYVALSLSHGRPLWLAISFGFVVGAGASVATHVALSGMRSRHVVVTASIATFALSILIGQVVQDIWSETAFPAAFPPTLIQVGRWQVPPLYLIALGCGILLTLATQVLLGRTPPGPVSRMIPIDFVSVAWAAAGGLAVLSGFFQSQIAFDPTFLQPVLVAALIAAIVGGLRSLPIAFAAGVLVEVARTLFQTYVVYVNSAFAPYGQTFLLIVLFAILLAAPSRWTGRASGTPA